MAFYKQLGAFAARYQLPLVIGWIIVALGIGILAPRISEVTTSDLATFLPTSAPFREAARVFAETFPNNSSGSSYLIVVNAPDGILNPDASTFEEQIATPVGQWITDFKTWLETSEIAATIAHVTSPTDSELMSQQLIANNQIALINISLSGSGVAQEVHKALDHYLNTNTLTGVQTYITGGTAITQSTAESGRETAENTLIVTVVLVIVLLLLIYRSPVSPLLPLGAVVLAYIISQGVVAWISRTIGMSISTYANILLVVVLFGAGTDYCLFLISRFREEMADTPDPAKATTNTLTQVGETIVSSAGTIFVGFIAMSFAEMGLFRTAGPVLAIGVVIMLLVGVTFVPALLALLGKRAFWPGKAVHRPTGSYYGRVSQFVSSRPVISIILIVGLMLPLAIYGLSTTVSYDMLGDLPDDDPAVIGYEMVRDNFGAGTIMPLNIVVVGRDAAAVPGEITDLVQRLSALPTVGDIRSIDDPLGQNGSIRNLTRVDGQLGLILDQLTEVGSGGASGANLIGVIGAMQSYLDLLVQQFPAMAADPNLIDLQTLLGNPLLLAMNRDALSTDFENLAAAFAAVPDAYLMPGALTPLLASADETQARLIDQLNNTFLANEGTAYRLTVIVNVNPNSDEALDTVQTIRTILTDYGDSQHAVVSGQPSILTDIRDTMNRDLLRTMALVILGIFVVLMLMLRSLIAPIYLILTVLITYAFSLGLTDLVFRVAFNVESLSWYMPFFTLIFLVALGVDYSIFLIGRVKEEVPRHGTREGVHKAVSATGAIITSAGIILAGTFAALLTGSIMGLVQLGFAVAFGVLVDTFVVRTMLVPAITVLLDKFAWWPGNALSAGKSGD